ncbi:hypothetical protein KORDIASMS9_04344 [Kordia sp. SMS9]|uniref:hypothetical protein n=1 Tax=Kordia sp. SMS9 TaxID=2282170 RepID=UPI000E0DCE5A|nr:hypothetical protein [Kordia sp. SMS9]AXG72082.1 hypothetical protein KORDIASMS9_04344 [Kordia sp. SMS9]
MKKRSIKTLELRKSTVSVLTDREKLSIEGGITPLTLSSIVCAEGAFYVTVAATAAISAKICD